MTHLIDKDALVAEIERLACQEHNSFCDKLLDYIDTIEVKEVDLEKEYKEFVVDDPIFGHFITNDTLGIELAKHFFELGIAVNNKAQKGEEI